ncbi:mitochondrial carrier [Xylona heveae TC161]|uniref:Mitochondrial carrier n=1 Tax=Xylona heveae (strain CBS 132557 / TC161) TaxID=1328760 RepID=A0A165F927_XYLHT|nr:mitochondrial carrier [Xylona heveae TC161]KZF20720.1 mitochondrial carrier [Xylona heveae TC161]
MTTPLDVDPTDFLRITPVVEQDEDGQPKHPQKKHAATGASAAGIRAFSAQFLSFYFRAPVKAFFPTRVDYMAFARAINPRVRAKERWSWRMTTPGLLAHAVKYHGWSFIPNQVLPPLIANVSVGTILYTGYLQTLAHYHEPSAHSSKRPYPPPPPAATFAAGFTAGTIQSLVAAPLDALQVRFNVSDMLEGHYKSMWEYGRHKLQEIGLRGVFAGWTLSFLKDALGAAVFFSTFEYVKQQAYYGFVTQYYGSFQPPHPFLSPPTGGDGSSTFSTSPSSSPFRQPTAPSLSSPSPSSPSSPSVDNPTFTQVDAAAIPGVPSPTPHLTDTNVPATPGIPSPSSSSESPDPFVIPDGPGDTAFLPAILPADYPTPRPTIKPHFTLEPAFLLLAGISAAIAQQIIQHPLTLIQNIHYERLEALDYQTRLEHTTGGVMKRYYHAYEKTFEQCQREARRAGGWRTWLYKGFFFCAMRQVPSTSAGLIVFELVRRKYGTQAEAAKIEKDGYDILLS